MGNLLIMCNVNKFKKSLDEKKAKLNSISSDGASEKNGDETSEFPAMSPARKQAELKLLEKGQGGEKEVEMVATATPPPAPTSVQEGDVAKDMEEQQTEEGEEAGGAEEEAG